MQVLIDYFLNIFCTHYFIRMSKSLLLYLPHYIIYEVAIQICAYIPRSPISLGKSGGSTYYPTLPRYSSRHN